MTPIEDDPRSVHSLKASVLAAGASPSCSPADARRWLRDATMLAGGGFHPDNAGRDYVLIDSGGRTFTDEEADAFDRALTRAWEALERAGRDIHEEGHSLAMRLLRTGRV